MVRKGENRMNSQTITTGKAEGNRQGRDPSLKPLPAPASLTEQGRSILSHLKFNHDVWRQPAQMTQGKKRSIIHRSYSILWPDFGTVTQRCSIQKCQKCCSKRTFQSFVWKTLLSIYNWFETLQNEFPGHRLVLVNPWLHILTHKPVTACVIQTAQGFPWQFLLHCQTEETTVGNACDTWFRKESLMGP